MQIRTFHRKNGHYVIPSERMDDFWRENLVGKADLLASAELKELGLTPKKLEYLFKKLRTSENSSIQYAGNKYLIEIVRLAGAAKTYITHTGLMALKSYLSAKKEQNQKKQGLQQKISELEKENAALRAFVETTHSRLSYIRWEAGVAASGKLLPMLEQIHEEAAHIVQPATPQKEA